MPEDPTTNTPMPPSEDGASAPAADPAAGGAQTTSDEQSAVQGQINNFVSSTPADAPATPADSGLGMPAPAGDSASAGIGDTVAPATPNEPGLGAPAADATSTDSPTVPPVTPPADTPPATPPETESPAPDSGQMPGAV